MKLVIDVGDIFILNDNAYLLVIDTLRPIDDDYGHMPASARVVVAVRGEFWGAEDAGFIFRNWGNQALDWVFIDPDQENLVCQSALQGLERVGQERDETIILRIWNALGDWYFHGNPNRGGLYDPRLRELCAESRAALQALDNPMGL